MNIAIMACKNINDVTCIGCQRCMTGFHRKDGEFQRYKSDPNCRIVAIFDCGGCPATAPVIRMKQLKDWITPMGETIDLLHIGTCVTKFCTYKETLLAMVKSKAGTEVIEGTHPYAPENIFSE